ncbi:outer membrane receptor protein involved in Fe transport [Runella defluvii]|uniref:Outer membrane receptor protein involved in Fe transport n=1 Tax=Runella defluvii TaxID=370973 RepID=A0A7W6ERQ3_9BACT|nr:outer membrane beta-barrel family protein [Runella defluvii]MBB3839910.1 outer membrane receptor protein involved in Fe transport [Runella defluvii]
MTRAIFLLLLSTHFLLAQTAKISGNVANTSQQPLDGAVISLLKSKDSTFVKAAITEPNGNFELLNIKAGAYLISISHLTYQKYLSKAFEVGQSDLVLPLIQLSEGEKTLAEVKVTGKKPFVETKIDRTVINVDALISNAGTNAMDVLEKSPGLAIDPNGGIRLKGKTGVVVFIDDKPTYLSAEDLSNYLKSLAAGSVETIEIMPNPPAKYDAAGNAGVINIRLKKNTVKGFNGGLSLSYGQGTYRRSNNSFNFNYRINKFNFFSNLSVNQNNSYQDLTIWRRYFQPNTTIFSSAFTQNSYIQRNIGGNNAKVGFDYYASKKATFGVVLTGFINPSHVDVTNKAKVFNASNEVTSLVEAISPTDKTLKNGSINLNYAYKLDSTGKELSTNVDYIHYQATTVQSLTNSLFDAQNKFVSQSVLVSSLPTNIDIGTAKIDYVHPLASGGKFETGVKTSFISTGNVADFSDQVDGKLFPNYEFTNSFNYNENINAGYLNYAKELRRLTVQAGLRFENTNIRGHQLGNKQTKDSTFTRNYNNLFPTLYMQYRLDSAAVHLLGFSFGRRIERPNYQDMNPFSYPLDRFTYYGGNPFLQPTFSYNFELSHTFKQRITTTLQYSIAKNVISETNEQRGTIYYSRPGNFGQRISYGISVNGSFQLAKWWSLNLYTEYISNGFKATLYGQKLDDSRFYWAVVPTNQFQLKDGWAAELAGSYQTTFLLGQLLIYPIGNVRAGVSKRIMKNKGTLKLNVSDVFYTNQIKGDIRNIANAEANWFSYLDTRVATLTFSYRFNKGKTLNLRQTGGSDSEKSRVKA